MGFSPKECGCFTIETAGIMIATKSAVQVLVPIFMLAPSVIQWNVNSKNLLLQFMGLIFAIGIFCICLLSIIGIETRNHRFIIPLMIWLHLEVLISILGWIFNDIKAFMLAFGLFWGALDIFGIIVLYCLHKKLREEPKSSASQQNQQPLHYTEKV